MSLLDEFKFPALAEDSQAFLSQNFDARTVEKNVHTLQVAGHDKRGLAYRFYLHPVKSLEKSKEFDMDLSDDVEMIQWFKDRKHKPVERVKELPEQLLKFARKRVSVQGGIEKYEYELSYTDPRDGKTKIALQSELRKLNAELLAQGVIQLEIKGKLIAKSGLYAEDYRRFQAGLGSLGLPLSRWDKVTLSQIHAFEAEGIFTVQQLAALPLDRVEGRFPRDLIAVFNEAVHYVNAQNKAADVTPFANEVLAVRQENSKLKETVDKLTSQMTAMMESLASKVGASEAPRRRGRPKKVQQVVEGTI